MPEIFDISNSAQSKPGASGGGGSGEAPRGTGTALDEYARNVLYLALSVFAIAFGYIIYGLFFDNSWSNPTFVQSDSATKLRHIANIATVGQAMLYSSIVSIACIVVCCLRDEGIGYVLAAFSAFCYFGLPYVAQSVFDAEHVSESWATDTALKAVGALWWIYAIPGLLFVAADIVRRFQAASENAAIQRANDKYGGSVARQRNRANERFMGKCWELPYCREHVKVKCPIFLRRRGPCWRYKEGCMCEERIVLQAEVPSDWKDRAAAVDQKMGLAGTIVTPTSSGAPLAAKPMPGMMGQPAQLPIKSNLTPEAKRDRCRRCVIYNEHQRQKYKVCVGATVVGVPAAAIILMPQLEAFVSSLLQSVEKISTRFALSSTTSTEIVEMHGSTGELLHNVVIGCIGLVFISVILRVAEWAVFKLKI